MSENNDKVINITDENGNVINYQDLPDEIKDLIKRNIINSNSINNESNISDSEEKLPLPELPDEYRDDSKESLSESPHYVKHLTEHWGF